MSLFWHQNKGAEFNMATGRNSLKILTDFLRLCCWSLSSKTIVFSLWYHSADYVGITASYISYEICHPSRLVLLVKCPHNTPTLYSSNSDCNKMESTEKICSQREHKADQSSTECGPLDQSESRCADAFLSVAKTRHVTKPSSSLFLCWSLSEKLKNNPFRSFKSYSFHLMYIIV